MNLLVLDMNCSDACKLRCHDSYSAGLSRNESGRKSDGIGTYITQCTLNTKHINGGVRNRLALDATPAALVFITLRWQDGTAILRSKRRCRQILRGSLIAPVDPAEHTPYDRQSYPAVAVSLAYSTDVSNSFGNLDPNA